ncbi:putative acetyltransferase [Nocardiopsis chromatogenes]|uniref:putative acetyltransferase n=1 Tax=Nocardiopsis chromatogenes TaxID=280239 RepID=UPI000344C0EA|nr:hypothetical protein [Nocardiopsis chromatogenes]
MAREASPGDVGRRAVLRVRLPDGRFRDIVGVLERWSEGTISVRRRDGAPVEVAEADVAGSRLVPQRPPERRRRTRGEPDTER